MTLDEAIKHCEEVAEEQERKAQCMGRQFVGTAMANYQNGCFECAADHRQLAEWLRELKECKTVKRGEWCQPLMGQGKCDTYCERCHGKIMRNSTGIFEETPFCPHCGADMRGDENA